MVVDAVSGDLLVPCFEWSSTGLVVLWGRAI
jgi:hypothetical protein